MNVEQIIKSQSKIFTHVNLDYYELHKKQIPLLKE